MHQTTINPVLDQVARQPLARNRTWLVVLALLVFALFTATIILLQSPPTSG